jgi:rSAM/selenodomain-associated transferase 2
MISVLIPTYNEASCIGRSLDRLAEIPGDFEVLVVDGESADASPRIVRSRRASFPRSLRLILAPRPRALQLNRAAEAARGEVLLFLHADVEVPAEAMTSLQSALGDPKIGGGNFQVVFDGASRLNGLFSFIYRLRRRWGIYYGDSGIFVRRHLFSRLGGFKPIPIMDDYEFVRRLERAGKTVCLAPKLRVSDRRWRRQGHLATLASWVWIQTLFALGVPAARLARFYAPVRETENSN